MRIFEIPLPLEGAVLLQLELADAPLRNYVYVLHLPAQKGEAPLTLAVDPTEAAPVLAVMAERGWALDGILTTHHHFDHTDGNKPLQQATGCYVIGNIADAARIPGLTHPCAAGDAFPLGGQEVQLIEVSGHTIGHVAYYFPSLEVLFCGDALFSLGCGRMFEGTAPQMLASMQRLKALPDATRVCCAHEYTSGNGKFAQALDPNNEDLQAYMKEVRRKRSAKQPTVPSLLGVEKRANPFLRTDDSAIVSGLGLAPNTPEAEVFATLRTRKDDF